MIEKKKNSIESEKINIALVGCGRISERHIKAIINENKRCRLIALCDNSEKRIKEAKESLKKEIKNTPYFEENLKSYNSYEKMLLEHQKKHLRIDLIILTTPSGLHPNQTILAANIGINVCTEKPMSIKLRDAEKMIKSCKTNNVKLFVVKQNRFNPTLQALKKNVESNKFGNIGIVNINVFWQRPQSYYDQDLWRGTKEFDGGALLNQASHYVDLLEWIIGPIEGVFATVSTISRNIEVEDTAVLQIKWKSGTLGTMAVTMITYPKNIEGSITIIGDKGSAKVGGIAVNEFEYCFFDDKNIENDLKKLNYSTDSVYGYGHFKYYENMLDNLFDKSEAICDGISGLSSIKIINAAYKSNKDKKYIRIN